MYWYEEEVRRLERLRPSNPWEVETVFYGSSSIRLWPAINNDFSFLKPANLGFGGSTLAACVWFFERIIEPYHPKRMIIYAGDNDLGDGRHPEEVLIFFQQLAYKIYLRFGSLPCYFLSLKPSPSRWHMANQFAFTNSLIRKEIARGHPNFHFVDLYQKMLTRSGTPERNFFIEDGLHLSEKGYQLWKNILTESIVA